MKSEYQRKKEYVRNAKQVRKHTCHWPGCLKQCPPAMWGCKVHWFKLPYDLRQLIWKHYQPGQEESMRPTLGYIEAANKVQEWINNQLGER